MKRLFALSLLLVSCGVPISLDPGQPQTPLILPSSGPQPSATPDLPQPSTSPTVNPSSNPSPSATAVSPQPTPQPSSQPTQTPSLQPTPAPTTSPKDVSVAESTTLNGRVYDDSGQPLDVSLSLRSQSGTAFSAKTQTLGGSYVFNAVPAGVLLELSAEAPGYSRVSQMIVLKSNRDGQPTSNQINFGGSGEFQTYFLTRGPRVISLTPLVETRFAAGTTPTFALRFDKAVDRSSVEAALSVTAAESIPLTGLTLNVGDTIVAPRNLRWTWNSASTEVSVRLPLLPARKGLSTRYQLQFKAPIRSAEGAQTPFQAVDGTALGPLWINQRASNHQTLIIDADETALRIKEFDWLNQRLRLVFNKPMAYYLGNPDSQRAAVGLDQAANYALRVDVSGDGSFSQQWPVQNISLLSDTLELGFNIPTALSGKNARLELLNGYIPEALTGQRLEQLINQTFKL